jgi:tRNA U34 5-methylaminomethyl-2-thiouridine-forming methyltransferase MnmC
VAAREAAERQAPHLLDRGPSAGRDEAARILAHWPELGEAAQVLLDHWPGRRGAFHRIDLPGFDAVLDLAVMDVVEALEAWDGAADAWFLDGFSPALNPAMWREEVLAAVAARSAPGARAATFTVAGFRATRPAGRGLRDRQAPRLRPQARAAGGLAAG